MSEQLRWVTRLFESNDVTHWVESGTFLTLVRSGRLTKYDEDIDLAILADDVGTVKDLIPEIEDRGYRVQTRTYHGLATKFQFLPTDREAFDRGSEPRMVDVMVFRRNETHAWTAQSRVKEEFATPFLRQLVERVTPLIERYAHSAGGTVEITSFPKQLLLEVFTLWLPRRFVDDVVYDEELGVYRPAAIDDYLTFRYDDWREPVAEWSLTDDRAIREAEPFEVVPPETVEDDGAVDVPPSGHRGR